jgi:outer membrane protein assembly factor BamA
LNIFHFRYEIQTSNVKFTLEKFLFLKSIFRFFVYLNIYTCFFCNLNAQEIKLSITAEKNISEELIDSLEVNFTFKDYLTLKKQVDTIPFQLQRIGYIESTLNLLQKKNDTLYEAIYFLGPKYKSIKIYYSQNDFSKKELIKVTNEINEDFFVLPFEDIELSLSKLNNTKTEQGNPFAKISLKNISIKDDFLEATLETNTGSKRTIDSIAIKGYEKFPKSFLKYYAGIKTGKTFNQKKLISQNNALNSLGFVSTIKPPEALFREENTTVYFYLEKQNNNLFDGVLGFNTNEETQKLEFNGYLNLELNNNLNFGEQFLINYKADGEDQRNFLVSTKFPYILKSPFGIGLELKIFKRDSTFVTTEQLAKVSYQINPSSSSYMGYKGYESSNLLDNIIAGAAIEDYTSRNLIFGVNYNKKTNSKLFPIKTLISLDAELGKRELKDSKENQFKVSNIINHIFDLNFKNSVFLQNTTSILFSDTYLTNELFRFGGINSIRGFNENSIDASLFSVLNTEYRIQLNEGLYIHSIIDLGYFENEVMDLKEKLYSFGLGLGLQTKAGILKLNIANGNSENQAFKFSNTKIHLSLRSRF